MEKTKILIIDDERTFRESLAEYLGLEGYVSHEAANGQDALAVLEREVFSAVLLDLRMPGMDGLEVLDRIRSDGLSIPVIIMSAHGDINDAVSAMKRGADDYLVKPFDPQELVVRLNRALESSRLLRLANLGKRLEEKAGSLGQTVGVEPRWLGDDPSMAPVISLVRKVAPVRTTVLVTGESGTGKEIIAKELHRLSPVCDGPFVPVNVGAIPESLQESELFGYEKGAFTGADNRKLGLFELASGGTLFLDELGEMSASLQVKLLRVLQERVIVRVGGVRPIPVDVRIVAATNRDLESAVAAGTFREDLYFRVNVIQIKIPPLRARPLDIPLLAKVFLARFARETGKKISLISPDALDLLVSYPFPGNVRELENIVERAVILGESDILQPEDFSLDHGLRVRLNTIKSELENTDHSSLPSNSVSSVLPSEPVSVRDAELQVIIAALERNEGHRENTAEELGISRRTLLNKMRGFNLSGSDFKKPLR